MQNTLITLAELSFSLGLIGIDEFYERIEIALWLSDNSGSVKDPRLLGDEDLNTKENEEIDRINISVSDSSDDENWIEFLFNNEWVFTKSDPDSYPSTPHGHFKNKNKKWPKLNPYNGRVFKKKHQEDVSKRLSKNELKKLWSDQKFRSFCREHIVWYMEAFPHHRFPVRRPLRLPQW